MFPSCPVVRSQGDPRAVSNGKYVNLESCLSTGDAVTVLLSSAMLAVQDARENMVSICKGRSLCEDDWRIVYIAGMAVMKAKKID